MYLGPRFAAKTSHRGLDYPVLPTDLELILTVGVNTPESVLYELGSTYLHDGR